MKKNRIKYGKNNLRSQLGAILAENVVALYLLFLVIFFPLLDLSTMGLNAFFLWFACNQAAMAGAKGTQWSAGNSNGTQAGQQYYETSIQTQAINVATATVNMFPGIKMNSGSPQLQVVLNAIAHTDTANNPPSQANHTFGAWQLPLNSGSTPPLVDTAQYIPLLRVIITGRVSPLFVIPGLIQPTQMTFMSEQQIEDAGALNS